MIREAIGRVVKGQDLSEGEMEKTMAEMLTGAASPAQIGSLLTALRMKGESVAEITGAVRAARARSVRIRTKNGLVSLDRDEINVEEETIRHTSDTGSGGTNTFNVSSATAFVVAGAGVRVAKHGYRANSGRCGSADVLSALGISLDLNLASVEKCIDEIGIGFVYAPLHQASLRYTAAPRQEIGLRTIFNLIGPLLNPAGAQALVLGVYGAQFTERTAEVLKRLGTARAFVVYGEGTLDEISICGPTQVSELLEGQVRTYEITPEDYGLTRAAPETIRGGNARENARIIQRVLEGEKGPRRDVVLLNAAAALVAAGVEADFRGGLQRAGRSVDSGSALGKLRELADYTQRCGAFVRKLL